MNPAADATAQLSPQLEPICTTALCHGRAVAYVSWRAHPQALPFCESCAARLASHGDTVVPLTARASAAATGRVA